MGRIAVLSSALGVEQRGRGDRMQLVVGISRADVNDAVRADRRALDASPPVVGPLRLRRGARGGRAAPPDPPALERKYCFLEVLGPRAWGLVAPAKKKKEN